MRRNRKATNIIVLDDSEFYNRLLTKQIQTYTEENNENFEFGFNVRSYEDPEAFLGEMGSYVDIAFVDYYLGEEYTGAFILEELLKVNPKCKVVIISQYGNQRTSENTKFKGASAFILKDKDMLTNTCLYLDKVLDNKEIA